MKNGLALCTLSVTVCLGLCSLPAGAQSDELDQVGDSIMKAAREMYVLESAGWTAVEAVKTKYSIEHIADYFAYRSDDMINVVFIMDNNNIKFTFRFADTLHPSEFLIDGKERKPCKMERRMIRILKRTNTHATRDDLVDFIEGTRFNTVVIPKAGGYDAYLLCGMENDSILPIGNDYRYSFSKKGRLKTFEKIHNNLITIPMRPEADSLSESVVSIHTHGANSSPYITVTDVCTMMLYRASLNWHVHIVFSNTHVSYLDLSRGHLTIMTREEYEGSGH